MQNIENIENNVNEVNEGLKATHTPARAKVNKLKPSALMIVAYALLGFGLTSATYSAWEYREQELATMRSLREANLRMSTELAVLKKRTPTTASWSDKLAFWKAAK